MRATNWVFNRKWSAILTSLPISGQPTRRSLLTTTRQISSTVKCPAPFLQRSSSFFFQSGQKLRHILFPSAYNCKACSYWQLAFEGLHLSSGMKICLSDHLGTLKLPQHYFSSEGGKGTSLWFARAIRTPLVLAVCFSWICCNCSCYSESCHGSQWFHERASKLGNTGKHRQGVLHFCAETQLATCQQSHCCSCSVKKKYEKCNIRWQFNVRVHDITCIQLLINHVKEMNLDMEECESNYWDK